MDSMHHLFFPNVGDGLSANVATAEILGVKLESPHNIRAWFPHPCDPCIKIWFIFDPCHMLKLMRNMLASWKVLLDGEAHSYSKIITVQFILH